MPSSLPLLHIRLSNGEAPQHTVRRIAVAAYWRVAAYSLLPLLHRYHVCCYGFSLNLSPATRSHPIRRLALEAMAPLYAIQR